MVGGEGWRDGRGWREAWVRKFGCGGLVERGVLGEAWLKMSLD